MSACIYRHAGEPRVCGKDKRPCRWYRAAWCIGWDATSAAVTGLCRMLLGKDND